MTGERNGALSKFPPSEASFLMSAPSAGAPFALLARGVAGIGGEVWTVRGWQPDMASWFGEAHPLREVVDLDLEEAFVELLRSARHPSGREA